MCKFSTILLYLNLIILFAPIFAQENENCFLIDFKPKNATVPPFEDKMQPESEVTVNITVDRTDTLGKISKYIFGNALAAWVGNDVDDPVLISHLQKLAPTLIRYPGGSWADIFFWNGNPGDLPSTIPDGSSGNPIPLNPQFGIGSWPTTTDTYYLVRDQVETQGLNTINYGYARYGQGEDPVARAGHLAADWVRFDYDRTLFWEIGNENGGPWEAGYRIDTLANQDDQPEIISGELYGQHFNIIADSMRTAAAEDGSVIFIGGQILHYDGTNSWNIADRQWNEGFFREVGDNADFYVIHNYFGEERDVRKILDIGTTLTKEMIDFIHQDIADKGAALKPIALTEWNMNVPASNWETVKTSFVNGMQSVIVFCEMIKLNYGMSSRWLIANWETDGMFYRGNDSSIPEWNPRPAFYYSYYLQQFTGDHAFSASDNSSDIVAYASTFSSGETGVVVVNKGTSAQVARILFPESGAGDYYYVYSLTGGGDNQYSQYVRVNNHAPTGLAWGPLEDLENLPAWRYAFNGQIKINSPGRSVQFVLIEPGDNPLSIENGETNISIHHFNLAQNYPNPFNPTTVIAYQLAEKSDVEISIYNLLGKKVTTLIKSRQEAGEYSVKWNGSGYASGVYFYRIITDHGFTDTKKLLLLK